MSQEDLSKQHRERIRKEYWRRIVSQETTRDRLLFRLWFEFDIVQRWFVFIFTAFAIPIIISSPFLFIVGLKKSSPEYQIIFSLACVLSVIFLGKSLLSELRRPYAPVVKIRSLRTQLEGRLHSIVLEHDYALPPPKVLDVLLGAGEQIFSGLRETPILLTTPRPDHSPELAASWDRLNAMWSQADELVFEAIVKSLTVYLSKLPRYRSAPFSVPYSKSASG
jgi:hypothetical protein